MMEQNALVVDGLTKQYRDFTLDHISFVFLAVDCGLNW